MPWAVDLHLHSCLSPCGDELMTPNNLAKMALLKGLDLIAVTDHNTASQLPAVEKVCAGLGLGLLPGMEITTREEAHLLAYFPSVAQAVDVSRWLYPHLPPIPNRPDFFGPQWVMDQEDEILREEPRLLLSAADLSIDQLARHIREAGGLAVPAHINRGGNGLLNVLGFLPPQAPFDALEISRALPCPPDPGIPDYPHLHSSDAHRLEDILERQEFLPLDAPTPQAFFDYIRGWQKITG